jgi:cysteine desulfurase
MILEKNLKKSTPFGTEFAIHSLYLDYQATTPIDQRVFQTMLPFMTEHYGNPHSSEHSLGWASHTAVENARMKIAEYVGALDCEIIFTSGTTESNNLVITGLAYAALEESKRRTILVSVIEHKCVLETARFVRRFGFDVRYIPVAPNGIVNMEAFMAMLSDDVLLVSVMAVNNEIGTHEPIAEIGALCKVRGILFHVDAAQGAYANIDVAENNVDFMSFSAHKIYGPKGVGALFINQYADLKPVPIIHGGGQENGFRSGTVPAFLAVGMGEACAVMQHERVTETIRLCSLRGMLLEGLRNYYPDLIVNGDMKKRHPGNLNIQLPDTETKQLIYVLQPHIAFSTGSACSSGIIAPSHVLKAIGLSTEQAERSFRLCVGRYTTEEDVKKAAALIGDTIR